MNLISTYGTCPKNPGLGAWSYVIAVNSEVIENSGYELKTTSNRVELISIIRGISDYINRSGERYVTVRSNSVNVVNAFNRDWIRCWRQKGWITTDKTPVAAIELWDQLLSLTRDLRVTWEYASDKHAGFLALKELRRSIE